jgi:hypothetical protein
MVILEGSGMRPGQIEHGEAEREPDRERKDLQAQQAVQLEATRQPATAAEEQRGSCPPRASTGTTGTSCSRASAMNPGPPAEPDLPGLQGRPVGLVISARVGQQRRIAIERAPHGRPWQRVGDPRSRGRPDAIPGSSGVVTHIASRATRS